jgi:hypothetical protein
MPAGYLRKRPKLPGRRSGRSDFRRGCEVENTLRIALRNRHSEGPSGNGDDKQHRGAALAKLPGAQRMITEGREELAAAQ